MRGQGQNKGERADRASGGNIVLSKTHFRSLRRLSEEIEFGGVLRNNNPHPGVPWERGLVWEGEMARNYLLVKD